MRFLLLTRLCNPKSCLDTGPGADAAYTVVQAQLVEDTA